MGYEPSENSRPSHRRKVLGVVWLSKTCIVPKAMIYKVQDYLTSMNVKKVQDFVGIWGLQDFILHLAKCLLPLCYRVKKGHMGLGTGAASSL